MGVTTGSRPFFLSATAQACDPEYPLG